MSSSLMSNGRLPRKAVKGGSVGTRLRSTSGPRAARGAVGRADRSMSGVNAYVESSAGDRHQIFETY